MACASSSSSLAIADRHVEAAEKAAKILKDAGIRVEIDGTAERLQAKIRTHTLQKVPILGIIGDREAESASIAVRERSGNDLGQIGIEKFLADLQNKIDKKVS